jgi:hypothetical protein
MFHSGSSAVKLLLGEHRSNHTRRWQNVLRWLLSRQRPGGGAAAIGAFDIDGSALPAAHAGRTGSEPDHADFLWRHQRVYLEQKSALFRKAPHWLHRLLDSPRLLKWAAGSAAKTRPEVGELTLSMVRGEEGNQARELNELVAWLKTASARTLFVSRILCSLGWPAESNPS